MMHQTRIISICFCVASLSACTIDDPNEYTTTQTYYTYNKEQDYYQNTNYSSYTTNDTQYANVPAEKAPVSVPDSSLVSASHSPVSHSDVDRTWVNSQNAQHYTIELANSEKASQVAGTLYKAPKNERTAEIKYQEGGKTYYKGLYGSYPSYEAAQQALNQLPDDIKHSAGIKSWGSVPK